MARARKARWKLRSGEERVREYIRALENKDRPQWSEEKVKEMADNARDVFTILFKLDECARKTSADIGIPTYRRVDVYRIVRRAWALKNEDAPPAQYCEEISYMARKYGFDMNTVNELLRRCGLPVCT